MRTILERAPHLPIAKITFATLTIIYLVLGLESAAIFIVELGFLWSTSLLTNRMIDRVMAK